MPGAKVCPGALRATPMAVDAHGTALVTAWLASGVPDQNQAVGRAIWSSEGVHSQRLPIAQAFIYFAYIVCLSESGGFTTRPKQPILHYTISAARYESCRCCMDQNRAAVVAAVAALRQMAMASLPVQP